MYAVKPARSVMPASAIHWPIPQARYKEPLGDKNWSSRAMHIAFSQDCGGQRMLRAEQLFRTDKLVDLTIELQDNSGWFSMKAKVLSQDHRSKAPGGAYTTNIRFEPFTDGQTKATAGALRQTTGWKNIVHAFHSGNSFPTSEAEPLVKALDHIPLIPKCCSHAAVASCNCGDFAPDKWCKHVAALGYAIIAKCETNPYYPFTVRNISIEGLLPRKRVREPIHNGDVICLSSDDEETASGTANHPIALCLVSVESTAIY